ncbi:MAG: hypothetical protein RSE36_04975 [Oscillospiraceae bacterium]
MNIERIIEQVDSSMTMEGMPLTKTDKERIRTCAGNNDKVVKKHSAVMEPAHEQRL